jgi:hypothetical protein
MADGFVVGSLGAKAGAACHYLVAEHIFKLGRFRGWFIRRLGAFSVLREGSDREALRAGVQILAEGRRPLVVFGEGTWYRQNDRLGPLQRGAVLMAEMAARASNRPIVIQPVAIRYWLLADPRPRLRQRLDALERHMGCSLLRPQGILARLEAVSVAWLRAQERAHLGREQAGDVEARRLGLLAELLARLEDHAFARQFNEQVMDRVRRLRTAFVRQLTSSGGDGQNTVVAKSLDLLLLCEQLYSHSLVTVRERPSWDRVAESVQRLAEIVWDEFERPVAPMGVVVDAGEAIEVSATRGRLAGGSDPSNDLTACVARRVQDQLDRLSADGPPAAWNVPVTAWGDPRAA